MADEQDPFADLRSTDPFADAIPKANVRVMAYGPIVGEHHHDAMFGPRGNALEPYDVAVSPNLGLNLGEWIEVNGKARRVADWSYVKPGVPTKDTVEIRDQKDQGRGTINRINLSADEIQKRISEYPQLAGEKTQGAERAAVKPAEVKGDPFADLIPKGEVKPSGRDPFADLTPPPRGFKGLEPGATIEESPTPTPIETPDVAPTQAPTAAPQKRAPMISAPTEPSPTPTFTPVTFPAQQPIPTSGAPATQLIPNPEALPTPQGGEGEPTIIQKTGSALGTYVSQMIPHSLEQVAQMSGVETDWSDPFVDLGFLVPPVRPGLQLWQQAYHRMQQIREAEQTPAMSQARFDAGIGTALDLLGMAGLAGGVKAGMRPRAETYRTRTGTLTVQPYAQQPPTVPPVTAATPPEQPPAPPVQPPVPQGTESLNPVRGSGKFIRSYRIDKELGDRMEGIGAARESGALRAETESRNLLDGLTTAQETDLGRYLVSRRLETVNPDHPQIISDIESRRIESDPAISKALDYYKANIKPEIEAFRKRAGLSEKAAAGKAPEFISLIPKTLDLIPQQTATGRFINPAKLPRTTIFSRAANGFAKEYNVNMRDILNESYGEVIRKARTREFYDAAVRKGLVNKATVQMPDGNFVKVAQFDDLPPELKHDLTEATKVNLAPVGLQRVGQIYQRAVTGLALTANPAELVNHMRRQLNLVAAKPPIGSGLLARLEALVPYFGPKLGAFKRTIMDNMSAPENQAILKDIFDAGGGSTRSFHEQYNLQPQNKVLGALNKYSGLQWLQRKTNNLLFGVPKGYGINGWDLRMRVQLERIRRSAEGNVDPQRIREFANQIGQYGRHNSWAVEALKKINPYAATTLPMRWTELKTAIGNTGLKEGLSVRTLLHRGETIMRGTGGTILALTTANYLLSGKWPWENDKGHEFDLNTGVQSKDGKTVYVKLRAVAPELSRPVSTVSIPDVLRERSAIHPQYASAALTGPLNQAASLVSGPGQNFAVTALSGKVPYFLKRPGEGPELMDVATTKKSERGSSRAAKQLKAAAAGINPFGEIFGPQFDVEVEGGLGYLQEPIRGIKPFGNIFSTSYERRRGSGAAPPPPAPPPPPPIR